MAISFKSREDIAAFICRETDAEKGARSGREERPESHCIRFGCSWTLAQKKDGAELALQEPIPAAVRGKIIRILPRVAAVPVFFLCQSLRTAHRIQKTCVLFFAVLPLLLFRVRIHPLPEDISDSLRRALADAIHPCSLSILSVCSACASPVF